MRPRHQRVQIVDRHRPVLWRRRGDRDDLLREDVERVARHHRRLDRALAHAAGHDRALEQVGAELGEDAAAADVADRVAGAADPLQPACHRLGRLDLDHEVDRAHVDPELERRGRHQARQLAGLQHLLDHLALLARQRAVMGARDLVLGQLVQPQREPLGAAAVVDEQDRRAVGVDQIDQLGVDRRPDRSACRLAAGQRVQIRPRVCAANSQGSRPRASPSRPRATPQAPPSSRPGRGFAGRAPCGPRCRRSGRSAVARPGSGRPPRAGSASPTGRSAAPRVRRLGQPLERQRQVRPALGRRRPRGSRRRCTTAVPANSSCARPVSIR